MTHAEKAPATPQHRGFDTNTPQEGTNMPQMAATRSPHKRCPQAAAGKREGGRQSWSPLKHVWGKAVDVTKVQLEKRQSQLSHRSPLLSLPSQGHFSYHEHAAKPTSQSQAEGASMEPAETSHSTHSATLPTLQPHPTSETLHGTGKRWLAQLYFKATPGSKLAASWDMPPPPSCPALS